MKYCICLKIANNGIMYKVYEVFFKCRQKVMKSYCGSDVGVRLTQLLSQALCQRRHSELGGAVEMNVSTVNDTMSAHAATEEDVQVVGKVNQDARRAATISRLIN